MNKVVKKTFKIYPKAIKIGSKSIKHRSKIGENGPGTVLDAGSLPRRLREASCQTQFRLILFAYFTLWPFSKKINKSMPTCSQNQLQTRSDTAAPQGHRPLEARELKARNRQKLATLAQKKVEKVSQNHQNITVMAPKICAKSMKNRGCVPDTF